MLIRNRIRFWKFIILAVSLVVLSIACTDQVASCTLDNLLLDRDLLPKNTYVEPIVSPIAEKPTQSFAQGFYSEPDDISYIVIQWENARAAEREYQSILKAAFDEDQYMGPWETPSELSKLQHTADQYFTACGADLGRNQCRMVARYNMYTVYLRTSLSDNGITFSRFIDLLESIENKMAQCED